MFFCYIIITASKESFDNQKSITKKSKTQWQLAPEVDVERVAQKIEGYSRDDLTNICRDASLNGMRGEIAGKTIDEIDQEHIEVRNAGNFDYDGRLPRSCR
ncbi:hypothetical protein RDI58_017642 [Solanum bulbocastanum]|uniref:AAA ATPase AAA+ lid domain-containing protein n=1 Tax=Solanum bulbocastanum TaxID=147425 RepID=A0AAN8T942_SOLBU